MTTIDYYFATVSPYTYLAGTRLEQIAAKHGVEITYKPLDIVAQFARTGGIHPKDRHDSRKEYRSQELRRQSARQGMTLNLLPAFWPTNMAPSSYAIIAAAKVGGDMGKLVHEFGLSVWAREENIAENDVIRRCLTNAGFDPDLADADMLNGAMTYEQNLEDAVKAGAFGAPFYIVTDTDERFWGQDRLDDLDLYLEGLG